MSMKNLPERINELGAQLKGLDKDKDSARIESIWLAIFTELGFFDPKMQNAVARMLAGSSKKLDIRYMDPNSFIDTLLLVATEAYQLFSPEKGRLWSFLVYRYTFRYITDQRKAKGRDFEREFVSMDQPLKDGDDHTLQDILDDSTDNYAEITGSSANDLYLYEISSMILHFKECHNKKQGNATRENYFRLFFTSDVTGFVNYEHPRGCPQFQHQTEIESVLKLSFVDYCMTEPCRTIPEIYHGNMKLYGEVVDCKANDPAAACPIPTPDIPDTVGQFYLKRVEGKSVAKSTYSEQHTSYKEEIKTLLLKRA